MNSSKSLAKVFTSCCASAFLMEILMAKTPESANFITFLQFFAITIYGFVTIAKFGTVSPKIPMQQYAILIALFFVTSVANNYVYALHVPSTLHMIIRSASSPASMLVYCYTKKQRPKMLKVVGSILISIGVAMAMYGGAPTEQSRGTFVYWCVGVSILLGTLITGAYTGLQQETLYAKYGKHPNEMLFYTHALPLPMFLGILPQIKETSSTLTIEMWLLIALNIVSQFYCTHAVHELASMENPVTVTFILTLRKFISLLISSIFFKSNLTVFHVLGTVLVAVGTYVYFDFFARKRQRPVSMKEE